MSRYPALARNGIPFRWSHTPELARRLNRIARAGAAVLGAAGGGRSIEMIEKMRRRTIMASCQLEGNPLDEMDVAALLAGRVIPGPFTVQPEHAREITNYRDALDHSLGLADAHRPVRIPDFCAIQDRLMRGLLPAEACGRIRSVPMATYYVETGEKIADAPEPDELSGWMIPRARTPPCVPSRFILSGVRFTLSWKATGARRG